MMYQGLDSFVDSYDAFPWLKQTRNMIWWLLDVENLEASSQVVKFYYYKDPFNKNSEVKKQILAFTHGGSIIEGTPTFDAKDRGRSVELRVMSAKDIQRLVLQASTDYNDPDSLTLQVLMKDGSTVLLDSHDANSAWARNCKERIREIAQHLLRFMEEPVAPVA